MSVIDNHTDARADAHFDTVSQARSHFSDLLDAAEASPQPVRRNATRVAVVDADRLRYLLGQ